VPNCRAVIDFLSDYVEGRLPIGQRWRFRLHLLLCRTCRAYLHNFRVTIHAARFACLLKSEIPEELVQAVRACCDRKPSAD
jgi:predicted anti-sigma-YlaC factor YlaD